jgi:NAD(P)-dependent dehydrogenase (short-subunit alcohol dehydrogenase family)
LRDFQDKGAFVTGAANGFGFALARAFGRARMKVMLADIDVDGLENAVAELKKDQISVRSVECDVSDRVSVQRAAAETLSAFGKVHVVCSNAGVFTGGALERISAGDWDWVLGVNLMGFAHVVQAFLPHIRAHEEGGHIVATSSLTAMVPSVPGIGPYTAAKAGILSLSQTLAAELSGSSIGVSVVCPGIMRTRIAESARIRPKRFGEATAGSQGDVNTFASMVNSGMDPDEVAEKVMQGIKENKLYVFTHPEWRSTVEEYFQQILAAYPNA